MDRFVRYRMKKAKHMRFGIDKQQYELISILSH